MEMKSVDAPIEKALLVGIQLPGTSERECSESLAELSRLVDTLGLVAIGQISQKRPSLRGSILVGEGKLAEIAAWTGGSGRVAPVVRRKLSKAQEKRLESEASDEDDAVEEEPEESSDLGEGIPAPTERAQVVVFDCELTPSQTRNLESATGARVLDRTGVIIDIFSRHAKTRASKLQVEIARLAYLAPRLRETGGGGDRQGGGIGGKGAGETAIELDRRRVRDRIKELKRELEAILEEQAGRRKRRSLEANSVALVGYTNAGKSSLMRAMTGSDAYIANKLFATLDTTVRPIWPETTPAILVSDTVGFIKKLPHDLVASFRSTLDEALNAALLFFVVDASDPAFPSQLATTRETLAEIEADDRPSWLILNKQDLLTPERRTELMAEYPDAIFVSSRSESEVSALRDRLIAHFDQGMEEVVLLIRYDAKGAVGDVRAKMRVLEETYSEEGVRLRVRAPAEALAQTLARHAEGVTREGGGSASVDKRR